VLIFLCWLEKQKERKKMIVITVVEENVPKSHSLYWDFQREKARRKMKKITLELFGKDITTEEFSSFKKNSPNWFGKLSEGKEGKTVCWFEKDEHDND
jgi:hypothetical protein